MREISVPLHVDVTVRINDPDVITRVTGPDGPNWRDRVYPLYTETDVLNHLAAVAVRAGVDRANQLDGWADLADDAATMVVADVSEGA